MDIRVEGGALDASRDVAQMEMAKDFAHRFGYDQVVILGRTVESDRLKGGEAVVHYGKTKDHATVAEAMGNYLKYRVMGWKRSGN